MYSRLTSPALMAAELPGERPMIRLSDVKVRLQYRWRVRQRLMVLHFARVHRPTAAGRRFGVSVRTIRRWRVRWRQNGLEGLGNPTPSTTGITGPLYQGPLPIVVDAGGHYSWAIAVSSTEARMITSGFGSLGVSAWRRLLPRRSDVPELPEQRLQRLGQRQEHLHERDDHRGPARPSFVLLRGYNGYGALGLPNFDEMAYCTDQQLADYIH